jgi:CheY-like chemotaxis protein
MQQTRPETAHRNTPAIGQRRPAVLVIDASAPARYALRLQLRALGVAVRQVGSVEQALAILDEARPDLIITAAVLPGMNALELLASLRARCGDRAPPLVIYCAGATWPLAHAAEAAGAATVVSATELRRRLPGLLHDAARRHRAAGASVTRDSRAAALAHRQDTALVAAAPDARRGHTAGRHACRYAVVVAALLGLCAGIWIAWVLWH